VPQCVTSCFLDFHRFGSVHIEPRRHYELAEDRTQVRILSAPRTPYESSLMLAIVGTSYTKCLTTSLPIIIAPPQELRPQSAEHSNQRTKYREIAADTALSVPHLGCTGQRRCQELTN
jgi:hypothetical protein